MLATKQIKFLREELGTAKNPLFFYDGDGDGLTAFLLLYRINREGKGIAMNTSSCLGEQFVRKVEELNPDKIFVLDIPLMTQEFVDAVKRPIFWIDHHPPQDLKNVHYYNPRIKNPDAYIPTSRMAWQISQRKEDLWIATAGSLADYSLPDFIEKFVEKYPIFLDKVYDLPTILFKKPVGKLVKLFFFLQKGPGSEVRKAIKVLTRIESPQEIFNDESASGKFLHKHFLKVDAKYELLLKQAKKCVTRSKLILFYYTEQQWSFTANLANELSGLYREKHVIIARKKGDEMKCSLRGSNVVKPLKKALEGLQGRGGGHPDACGAVINEQDWEQFLKKFKQELKKK